MHLRLHAVDFRYPGGSFCLAPPNLEIEPGQHAAFVGPSGSGKTTLLRLLAGIHTPQTGRVELSGEDTAPWPDARRRAFRIQNIGFIFQGTWIRTRLGCTEQGERADRGTDRDRRP